ncbi:asparaginase [Kocuria sp.]|uniref:asparaginase n=1 Tax=Kocuria sp. TaxID=1871328 RepID=UPI0026DF1165|nr:asparaginase [Kocuria sp.]MDO5618581.1 asparaginase [Kocuria sp.]
MTTQESPAPDPRPGSDLDIGLAVNGTVELARVRRSGLVESRHLGAAVVTAPDGQTLAVLGDAQAPIFARSALKPFQTAASLTAGAPIQWDQIAVASGSHQATDEQIASVRSILAKVGLDESALRCPAADRRGRPASADDAGSPLNYACSGKHAAFLAACVESQWDTETYLDPRHPLQREVVETITQFAGAEPRLIGTDGCGAPLPAITLTELGRMYSALGAAAYNIQADARLATVATAMLDYPEFVHAPGRANTVVMEELGVLAKFGAEGVLCLATQGGVSVVIKSLDGSGRANHLVGLELLIAAGAVDAVAARTVAQRLTPPVLGGDLTVGAFELGDGALTAVEHLTGRDSESQGSEPPRTDHAGSSDAPLAAGGESAT